MKEVGSALASITSDDIKKRLDLKAMYKANIYGVSERRNEIEEKDDADYYLEYFEYVKKFYADAAKRGNAVLFFLR